MQMNNNNHQIKKNMNNNNHQIKKNNKKKSLFLKLIKYIEHSNIKNKEKIIKLMLNFNNYKKNKINKLIGILAEFENYKKRIEKNKKLIIENANKNLLLELLSLAEDFNRCFNSNSNSNKEKDKNKNRCFNSNSNKEGIKIINRKLWNLLKKEGIKKIKSKKGDVFNTDIHEAVSIQTIKKTELKGKILHIIESGYSFKNKIIKYTKVIVGK
ncbi:nucleotide exchange factor GrpE [Candidatus Karelsulcia muelleri]